MGGPGGNPIANANLGFRGVNCIAILNTVLFGSDLMSKSFKDEIHNE